MSASKSKTDEAAKTMRLRSEFQSMLDMARFELNVDAYRGIFVSTDPSTSQPLYYAACFRKIDLDSNSAADDQCPAVKAWFDKELQEQMKIQSKTKTSTTKSQLHACQCCDYNPLCFVSLGGAIHDCFIAQNKLVHVMEEEGAEEENDARIVNDQSWKEFSTSNVMDLYSDESNIIEQEEPTMKKQKLYSTDMDLSKMVEQSQTSDHWHVDLTQNSSSSHQILREGGDYSLEQFTEADTDSNMQISPERGRPILTPKSTSTKKGVPVDYLDDNTQLVSVRQTQRRYNADISQDNQDIPPLRAFNHINRNKVEMYLRSLHIEKYGIQLDMDQVVDKIHCWQNTMLGSSSPATLNELSYCVPPGLTNLGATCYLNSLFQCLAFNLAFMDGVLSWTCTKTSNSEQDEDSERLFNFLSELQLLLSRMTLGSWKSLSTKDFLKTLGLAADEMQDPHEFQRLLFDLILRSLQDTRVDSKSKSLKKMQQLLPTTFGGKSIFKTTCQKCLKSTFSKQEFLDVSIPIIKQDPSKKRSGRNGKKKGDRANFACSTVQDCLDRYFQSESVAEYTCENCRSKQDVERCMLIEKLPPVLNVHLLRYDFDLITSQRKKLMDKILLSKSIQVPIHDLVKKEWKQTGLNNYILCAIQLHKGVSAHGGHYIAEVMDWLTGTWMEFNDNDVEILSNGSSCTIDPNNPGDETDVQGSSDAYSLFYVEEKFLAAQVGDHLKRIFDGFYDQTSKIGIIGRMAHERRETQRLMQEMALQRKIVHERLAERKQRLIHEFLPELGSETRSYKNGDSLYWVHADILRRFISCQDTLDDVVTSRDYFLKNKQYLCAHAIGLHPRTAREGKMLPQKSYNTFISMLESERTSIQMENPCELVATADLTITNKSHLFCQHCVDSFKIELGPRIYLLDVASQLVDLFSDDFSEVISTSDHDDEYTYVVSKQFISAFLRIMKHRMQEILSQRHRGIDNLDMKLFNFEESSQSEGLDLRVNTAITCPFGNCHVSGNRKIVRHVSFGVWSKIITLFPSAIRHRIDERAFGQSLASSQCAECLRDHEKRTDLSTNLLSWANRVADDKVLSGLLSESAYTCILIDECPERRLFFVHKSDIDNWRYAVNFICGTFETMKGKAIAKGKKIKDHLENKLFMVHEQGSLDQHRNEPMLHRIKFRSLLCLEHNHLLGRLFPIHEMIRNIPIFQKQLDEEDDHQLDRWPATTKNEVEVLSEQEYQAYLGSLHDLADALVLTLQNQNESSTFTYFHPSVCTKEDDLGMHQSTSFIDGSGEPEFKPGLCMDRNCLSRWTQDISSEEEVSISEAVDESNKSTVVDKESMESYSQPSSVKFQVYEVSDDTDLNSFSTSLKCQDAHQSATDEACSHGARRSSRSRKKSTFAVNVEFDANIANLKLLVLQKTKIEHISDIAFYACLNTLIPLGDEMNKKSVSQILAGVSLISNDPILLLQVGSQSVTTSKAERKDKDESIMASLMSLIGDSKNTRKQVVERGFQGTLLQSNSKCSSAVKNAKVDIVELVD